MSSFSPSIPASFLPSLSPVVIPYLLLFYFLLPHFCPFPSFPFTFIYVFFLLSTLPPLRFSCLLSRSLRLFAASFHTSSLLVYLFLIPFSLTPSVFLLSFSPPPPPLSFDFSLPPSLCHIVCLVITSSLHPSHLLTFPTISFLLTLLLIHLLPCFLTPSSSLLPFLCLFFN